MRPCACTVLRLGRWCLGFAACCEAYCKPTLARTCKHTLARTCKHALARTCKHTLARTCKHKLACTCKQASMRLASIRLPRLASIFLPGRASMRLPGLASMRLPGLARHTLARCWHVPCFVLCVRVSCWSVLRLALACWLCVEAASVRVVTGRAVTYCILRMSVRKFAWRAWK